MNRWNNEEVRKMTNFKCSAVPFERNDAKWTPDTTLDMLPSGVFGVARVISEYIKMEKVYTYDVGADEGIKDSIDIPSDMEGTEIFVRVTVPFISDNPLEYLDEEKCRNGKGESFVLAVKDRFIEASFIERVPGMPCMCGYNLLYVAAYIFYAMRFDKYEITDMISRRKARGYARDQLFPVERNAQILEKTFLRLNWTRTDYILTRDYVEETSEIVMPDMDYGDIAHRTTPVVVYVHDESKDSRFVSSAVYPSHKKVVLGTPMEILADIDRYNAFPENKIHYAVVYDILNKIGGGQTLSDTVDSYKNCVGKYEDKYIKFKRKRLSFESKSESELVSTVEKVFERPEELWMLKGNSMPGLRGFVTAETVAGATDAAYSVMELMRRNKGNPFSRVVELEYYNSNARGVNRNEIAVKGEQPGVGHLLRVLGDNRECDFEEYVFENQNLYILPVGAINGENVFEDATVKDVEAIVSRIESAGDDMSVLLVGRECDIRNLIRGSEKIKFYFTDGIFDVTKTTQTALYRTILSKLPQELRGDEKFRKDLREYVRDMQNSERLDPDIIARSIVRKLTVSRLTGTPADFKIDRPFEEQSVSCMLKSLIGLKKFKEEMKSFRAEIEFCGNVTNSQKRAGRNYHMLFVGDPGTGKTKCARIMAKVLHEAGVLPTEKMLEVSGNDLGNNVGQYFREAEGGVLFIDEAYTLASRNSTVADLVREMENHRDEVVVILAGYEGAMNSLIHTNEGLFSRIGKVFHFENYTPEELLAIFKQKAGDRGLSVAAEADALLLEIMTGYSYTPNFGNGRFAEKLLQKSENIHANRVKKARVKKDDPLYLTLMPEDIPTMKDLVEAEPGSHLNIDIDDTRTAYEKLDSLVGLKKLKTGIKEFAAYARFANAGIDKDARKAMNFHMAFLGNPGTGKTEVARIMAKLLHEVGVLPTPRFTEINGAELANNPIAPMIVPAIMNVAKGGVLFIDEAYSICRSEDDQFGRATVSAILTGMEENRDKMCVIFAGYEKEMKEFFDVNPGFKSRVRNTFCFDDYTPGELLEIFELKAKGLGLTLDESGREAVLKVMAGYSSTPKFGNGRFAETLLQYSEVKHAVRMEAQKKTPRCKDYRVLTGTDIPTVPEVMEKETNRKVNKNLEMFRTSDELLAGLIGLENIKKELADFRAYARYAGSESNPEARANKNFHMMFLGNPGTGKTETARIIAKILHEAGILPTERFVEVSRGDLVGEYVGHTAPKVQKCVEEATGGVLFIDEAYSLCSSEGDSYGHEAVATLIKEMEDKRDKLVVIFAGYDREMEEFMKSNSGLASRIGYTFHFDDYTPEQLTEIYRLKAAKRGLELSAEAEAAVLALMKSFREYPGLGNGRFAERVFQYTEVNFAKRIVSMPGGAVSKVIEAEDIPTVSEVIEKNPEKSHMWDPTAISEDSRRRTAIHEAGHAVCNKALCGGASMEQITVEGAVNGTGGAVALNMGELNAQGLLNTPFMYGLLVTYFGGKCAEDTVYGSHTTGCVSDIKAAKAFVKDMVEKYAMPYLTDDEEALEKKLLKEADALALQILAANKETLEKLADLVLEKGSLDRADIEKFFEGVTLAAADNPYGALPAFMSNDVA